MKHVFTLLTFAFLSSGLAQVPDYIPESGLIGWYPLDGSLESSIDPTQDGFLDGPVVTQDRFGNPNGALSFDGVDDFGTIEHYSAFENCAEMTISVWVNPATYPSNVVYCGGGTGASYLFLRKWSSTNESRTFEMALTNWAVGSTGPLTDGYLGFCNNGGCWGPGEMNGVGSWSDVPVNSWTHLAYVIGSDSSWVYVNGEVLYADTEGAAPNGLTTSNNPIYLGRAIGSFAQCQSVLNGKLDDIGFWNRALTEEEILSMYLSESLIQGCMDPMGCNFNPEAEEDDGSCDYTCCPGPGCCHAGTVWDVSLQQCVIAEPAYLNEPGETAVLNPCYFDSDDDGLVDVNDLMNLLTVYNLACGEIPETTASWQCGDPLEYQGYEYETVQIGVQCWFAENLRSTNYRDGSPIQTDLDDGAWSSSSGVGAYSIYGRSCSSCQDYTPELIACDNPNVDELFGHLYNQYAIFDERQLCPSGWYVPTEQDFQSLGSALGGMNVAASKMKADSFWNNSEGDNTIGNESGFSILPVGLRHDASGECRSAGLGTHLWSSTSGRDFVVSTMNAGLQSNGSNGRHGFVVRCIKDGE